MICAVLKAMLRLDDSRKNTPKTCLAINGAVQAI
jgi:hypothetical protein